MSEEKMLTDLFDQLERVWQEGRYDLISGCIGPNYIRHDEAGDRTVTLEAYAAEIAKLWLNLRALRMIKIEARARRSELV